MSETEETVREIRFNPIVPSESVLVVTARGMRPRDAEERIERKAEAHVDRCPSFRKMCITKSLTAAITTRSTISASSAR